MSTTRRVQKWSTNKQENLQIHEGLILEGRIDQELNKFWPLWWRVSFVDKSTHHAKPRSICFFYHNIKDTNEIFVKICWLGPAWKCTRLLMQNLLQTRSKCRENKKRMFGGKSNDAYSLSIRVETTFRLCFLPQCQRQMKFFFRARAEKGIVRHIDVSIVVWTVIDNGKLANRIARLAAIVVKICPSIPRVVGPRMLVVPVRS